MIKRAFDGVKVFSATLAANRQQLGETVTRWLEEARASRPGFQIVDIVVTQSSDAAFHMAAISIFYKEGKPRRG
jgi:hypothetical protein